MGKRIEATPWQTTGNLHRKDGIHSQFRSLTPSKAAGNALAIAVHDDRGFTLLELLVAMVTAAILMQMAWTFAIDIRTRTSNVAAIADGRNLFTTIRNNFVNLDDVDYTAIIGQELGVKTSGTIPDQPVEDRPAVFTLSPGVHAIVTGGSMSTGSADTSFFEAYIYHDNGTKDPASLGGSGRREFYYLADETTNPPSYVLGHQ